MKKSLLIILFSSLGFTGAIAEELTAEEKEAMLSKIETMENQVLDFNQTSQRSAMSIFRDAMSSDTAAFKLYTDCKKTIALEEEKKKFADVQKNIRKIKDETSKEFKRGLRYQLSWLVYSIEAARNPDARMQSAKKLVECLANIVKDADKLDKHTTLMPNRPEHKVDQLAHKLNEKKSLLKEDPFNSVFAKAYKLDHLKPEAWPTSPLDFDGLFKGLIMKDLIERGDFDGARESWLMRLKAERSLIEAYADDPDSAKFGEDSVDLEKYLEDRVPVLKWQGEKALFDGGDKRNATIAMFEILKQYPTHPESLNWIESLRSALSGESPEKEE